MITLRLRALTGAPPTLVAFAAAVLAFGLGIWICEKTARHLGVQQRHRLVRRVPRRVPRSATAAGTARSPGAFGRKT